MLKARFIIMRDVDLPWWKRAVLQFTEWLIPQIKVYGRLHKEICFRSEYMRDIHEMYARERAQLNKAVTKKGKLAKELEKALRASEKMQADNGKRTIEVLYEELKAAHRTAFNLTEFYQHRPDGLRALEDIQRYLKERIDSFAPKNTEEIK